MSTAEQIIAEHRDAGYLDGRRHCLCGWSTIDHDGIDPAAEHAAHVVAALTSAGKAIVDPNALDSAIWLYLGDECDNANEPNYEEDNYDAGFIAGLERAQVTIRTQLPALLAAARVAEGGDQP
ncbi:hypothetical protein GS448_24500 [Rhodococcus hoagii]|nr:hypothetical protein [Prescottella equi]MBM4670098.1 hypothetical protein [Prescottella equi]NKV87443.1 hypothetical protein [Prescottella equi]